MIRFENVSFSYSGEEVLNDVSFEMRDGQFIGILGPNGGGKSTFLKLALGLLSPDKGKIVKTDKHISYIAQTTSLSDASFPATVEEVIALGLVNGRLDFHFKEKKAKVDQVIQEMELEPFRKRLVSELSGGQLQRVKIAKALVSNPSLIVLDEPDAGMDEHAHHHLLEVIHSLHERHISLLFVSHHPHDLEEADQIYFIEEGKILTYQEELQRGHHHVDL